MVLTNLIANKHSPSLFNKPKVNLKEEFAKLRIKELSIQRKKKRTTNPDKLKHSKPLEYNKLFIRYLGDIESITGIPISPKQRELIKKAIESKRYTKLSKAESQAHRREYSSKRKELIAEWEKETGQTFPKYDKPVYSKNGKIVRNVGDTWDCHHIVECSWGGMNHWSNIHPARFPDLHQQGIHRKGGYADQIFNQSR